MKRLIVQTLSAMFASVFTVITIAAIAPSIALAQSDEIPTLDVRPVCRGIALQSADPGVGQGAQAETLQRCIESEKEVREQLKKRWGEFSAADKRHCVTLAKTGGESSNTELLTCLKWPVMYEFKGRQPRRIRSPPNRLPRFRHRPRLRRRPKLRRP